MDLSGFKSGSMNEMLERVNDREIRNI